MTKTFMIGLVPALLAGFMVSCGGGDEPSNNNVPTGGEKEINKDTVGSATITVKYAGEPFDPGTVEAIGNSCDTLTGGTVPKENLIVNANKTVRNALVYVVKGHEEYKWDKATETVVLDQVNCQYTPHVLAAQVGQSIEIHNGDNIAHNVHGFPSKNGAEFNKSQGSKGDNTYKLRLRRQEIGIFVKCDVHSWMNAYIHAVEHPWFGLTGEDGTVKLDGLPPGKYTIHVWHEKYKKNEQKVEVTVPEKGNVAGEVTFPAV